jgi:diguanylate cyclase (GGDEF)-like protein/PAS domain S-box-containing protein
MAGLFSKAGGLDAEGLLLSLDALPSLAFVERDGCIVAQNHVAAALTGMAGSQPVAVERVFLGGFPFASEEQAGAVRVAGEPVSFACLLLCKSGAVAAVHGAVRELPGRGQRLIVALEDGLMADEQGQDGCFPGDLMDAAPEAMAITYDGRLLHVNRAFRGLFGYGAEECIGQLLDPLLSSQMAPKETEMMYHQIASRGSATLESVRYTREGQAVDVSIFMGPVRLSAGVHGLFYTFRDIRSQKEEVAGLRHSALHDALTDLPNRTLLLDRLNGARARLRRDALRQFAIVYLDLDGFKEVNDSLGHGAGDALLMEIAARLRGCVKPQDTVARMGGDEFALLLDTAGSMEDIERTALRIQEAVSRPVVLDSVEVRVTASIGIELVEEDGVSPEETLRRADVAMYRAKARGKGRHEMYCCGMSLPKSPAWRS